MKSAPFGCSSPIMMVTPDEDGATFTFDQLIGWMRDNRAPIGQNLDQYGAILFRGFSITRPEEFKAVVHGYDTELRPYMEGQSQRKRILENIYNSTYYPPRYDITIHNELSYASSPPSRIYFCCLTPAQAGGSTPLVDCRLMLERLNPVLRERFQEKGIMYVKNMHGGKGLGKSWQEHFETSNRQVVEAYLEKGGVAFEWRPDGGLRTVQTRPATIRHPRTGEELWFNQATLWHASDIKTVDMIKSVGEDNLPTHAYFGDGSTIPPEDLQAVRDLSWELANIFPWEVGDCVMVDNFTVAHGRTSYEGPRHILVAMA